jgi:RNA methyltransferase, TrmH family
MMITSRDNEKLKLVRKLRQRKHRDRDRLFLTEGEDLLEAAVGAGRQPELVLSAAGSGLGGDEVAPDLLDSVSTLGSGTRVIAVWRQVWAQPSARLCIYLDGVGDPANVGAVVRTAHALVDATVVLGPRCADPYSPKAARASMGSTFAQPVARAPVDATPRPRIALVAHGGAELDAAQPPLTLCIGAERQGLSREVLAACERRWTIPLRAGGAESLNVAAAAAIALGRISSATAEERQMA